VYIRLRKGPTRHEPVVAVADAGERLSVTPAIDAAASPDARFVAGADATVADASRIATAGDAGGDAPRVSSAVDAGSSEAITADASQETKTQQAKLLVEKAYAAIEEGRFQQALDLVEESLKLRRTARTLLVRAQAQQRRDQ